MIFGNGSPTSAGKRGCDYIHVVDFALGRLNAWHGLVVRPSCYVRNLCTGKGYSILVIISAFERVSGQHVSFQFALRRLGDGASCSVDSITVARAIGWKAWRNLHRMQCDAWRRQSMSPNGFAA